MYHSVSGLDWFSIPYSCGEKYLADIKIKYIVEWGHRCVNLHFSPYTHAPLRDGGFEIWEQDVKTSQA